MQENLYFSATTNYGQKKDGSNSLFDFTMGSFDGAEICELVGLYILNHLGKRFGKENIGLHRDDSLAIIKSKSACLLDQTRKELHKIFEQFDLKISAEVNLNVVIFFDVSFDLNNTKHKPYRKPNDDPLYINRHSNHPPSITRQLPTAINKHIALLSLDEQTFKESTPIYQNALRHSNFDHKFTYTQDASQQTHRNRQRNIIWLNNVKSIITKHNTHIIRNSQSQNTETDNCNCDNKNACPLPKQCMTNNIIYKATVTTKNTNDTKHYIGMTATTFKEHYANHTSSFRHKRDSNKTELSKHIWKLKENNQDYTIKL
jgi:hypothetical protein